MTGDPHDGAILINKFGEVVQNDTGLLFNPKAYLKERGKDCHGLSKQFCFEENVGTRHIAAKSYSLEQEVVVVTLSEETGHIRVFDRGYTVYSDVSSEIEVKKVIPVSERNRHNHQTGLRYLRRVG